MSAGDGPVGTLDRLAGLAGKVAVVTGGAGGLGEPITRLLAECGTSVAVCDRDNAALDQLDANLRGAGQPALCARLDVRDADALDAFFGAVDDRFGHVDILVNVPGGTFHAAFLDTKRRGWDAVIRQNFTHVLQASHLAATRMRARGGGSIVSITSVEGHRAVPYLGIYGAMKAAVAALTRTLALELAPHGIRVNAVAPDIFPTPATDRAGWTAALVDPAVAALQQRVAVPIGRYGRTDELACAVVFMVSDLASYVTGTTLFVDGGTMASSGWSHWPDGYTNIPPDDVAASLLGRERADDIAQPAPQMEGSP